VSHRVQTTKADVAIAQVLEAEREALAAIGRCEDEARALAAAAREEARRIAARAEQRLAAAQARLAARARARMALLEAESTRLGVASGEQPGARLRAEAAVRSLAAELLAGGGG
jgi:hypothetical protein